MMKSKEEQQKEWREAKRRYREGIKEFVVACTRKEQKRLEATAESKNLSVPKLLKLSALQVAYQDAVDILPSESQRQEVLLATRKIGNLVNQLVRYCHRSQNVSTGDIQNIHGHLGSLEKTVGQILFSPVTIREYLKVYLTRFPEKQEALIDMIQQYCDTKD